MFGKWFGALFGQWFGQSDQPVVEEQQAAGRIRIRRAVTTPSVSFKNATRGAVLFPYAEVRIVVAASPQFTACRVRCRIRGLSEPYTGLTTPTASRRARGGVSVRRPAAAGVAPFVHGRGFIGGGVDLPAAGAAPQSVSDRSYSNGLVLPPTCVKNLMSEMMMFF
jgi:hypothetical protein